MKNLKVFLIFSIIYILLIAFVANHLNSDVVIKILIFLGLIFASYLFESLLNKNFNSSTFVTGLSLLILFNKDHLKYINYMDKLYILRIKGDTIYLYLFSNFFYQEHSFDLKNKFNQSSIEYIEKCINIMINIGDSNRSIHYNEIKDWDGHFDDTTRRSSIINKIIK